MPTSLSSKSSLGTMGDQFNDENDEGDDVCITSCFMLCFRQTLYNGIKWWNIILIILYIIQLIEQ